MKKNKTIYYAMIFMVLIIIFSLFEGAILTSEVLITTGEKLFWSGLNVAFLIGLPVTIVSVMKLSD